MTSHPHRFFLSAGFTTADDTVVKCFAQRHTCHSAVVKPSPSPSCRTVTVQRCPRHQCPSTGELKKTALLSKYLENKFFLMVLRWEKPLFSLQISVFLNFFTFKFTFEILAHRLNLQLIDIFLNLDEIKKRNICHFFPSVFQNKS